MPKGCATCEPIARISLVAGFILVALGALNTFLLWGLRWFSLALFAAPVAWLVGLMAGVWGWIRGRGDASTEPDWVYVLVTLFNGFLFLVSLLVIIL